MDSGGGNGALDVRLTHYTRKHNRPLQTSFARLRQSLSCRPSLHLQCRALACFASYHDILRRGEPGGGERGRGGVVKLLVCTLLGDEGRKKKKKKGTPRARGIN